MTRASHQKRRRARFKRHAFLNRNKRIIAIALIGFAVIATAAYFFTSVLSPVVVALIAVGSLLVLLRILRIVQSANYAMPTVLADEWTAQEFRRLGKGGWQVLDDISCNGVTIRFVAVGPSGIIAIDTAVAMEPWTLSAQKLEGPTVDPLPAIRHAADTLRKVVNQLEAGIPVIPALVIWGPGAPFHLDGQEVVDGVAVLIGKQAPEWRVDLRGKNLDQAAIKELASALRKGVPPESQQETPQRRESALAQNSSSS